VVREFPFENHLNLSGLHVNLHDENDCEDLYQNIAMSKGITLINPSSTNTKVVA
jgi:hypothetical protein